MKYGHKGNAKKTTLAGGITSVSLTFSVADPTGWPDGSTGPFWAAIDKGLNTEEKILCSGRVGAVVQVWTYLTENGRGKDDTVAQDHAINATVEHIWTATEAEEASTHSNTTDGAHGYPDIVEVVTRDGVQTLTNKTIESPTFTGTVTGISVEVLSPFLLMGA
jgi:hypothetical protein